MKIRAKISAHGAVSAALESAIQSGMNKCDKYHEGPLTEAQRNLLLQHIDNYFWLALDEAGVELK